VECRVARVCVLVKENEEFYVLRFYKTTRQARKDLFV
jgi:hypothetical protein